MIQCKWRWWSLKVGGGSSSIVGSASSLHHPAPSSGQPLHFFWISFRYSAPSSGQLWHLLTVFLFGYSFTTQQIFRVILKTGHSKNQTKHSNFKNIFMQYSHKKPWIELITSFSDFSPLPPLRTPAPGMTILKTPCICNQNLHWIQTYITNIYHFKNFSSSFFSSLCPYLSPVCSPHRPCTLLQVKQKISSHKNILWEGFVLSKPL